jgi:hypothetical protein
LLAWRWAADLTLVGTDVVCLVLGSQRSETGRFFELFGSGIRIMLLSSTVGWIHLSMRRPGRWLRWTRIESAAKASLFVLALPWGARRHGCGLDRILWDPIGSILLACQASNRVWCTVYDSCCLEVCCRAPPSGLSDCRHHPRHAILGHSSRRKRCAGATIIISAPFATLYLGTVILPHWGLCAAAAGCQPSVRARPREKVREPRSSRG